MAIFLELVGIVLLSSRCRCTGDPMPTLNHAFDPQRRVRPVKAAPGRPIAKHTKSFAGIMVPKVVLIDSTRLEVLPIKPSRFSRSEHAACWHYERPLA